MPDVKKVVEAFKKLYGKEGESKYYAWKKKNPDKDEESLKTARKKGDKVVEHK